ncbi:MAG: transglycosylase domain-containing protein [Gracilibacteraceae bacterium]|jgi:penicillin-binding protein 1A|nr:transglycosylase domain-containing protein [Gracilibacteraceae bacterium]
MKNPLKSVINAITKGLSKMPAALKRILIVAGALLLLACLGIGGFVGAAVAKLPSWDTAMLDTTGFTSTVYDKDSNPIAYLSSDENRLFFQYEDVPELFLQTIVAVNDKRFYKHKGADFARLAKGAVSRTSSDNQPVSTSTITIQLAKDAFLLWEDRPIPSGLSGLKRKIQEIYLARQIEKKYSKNEILTLFLNRIFFGHGAYGARSAAWVFCGKELDQLTIPDIALLCGLPAAPGSNDPYFDTERAKSRQVHILSIMRDENLITSEEYERYKEEPLTYIESIKERAADEFESVLRGPGSPKKYPFFVDYVVNCLLDPEMYNLTPDQIYKGGLHIYTTVDPIMQQTAEEAMKDPANFPKSPNDISVQGALVVLENGTGNVAVMVGGREYPPGQMLCFNRATEGRQPGSLAHALMAYAPALELGGYSPHSILNDDPTTFPGNYRPRNRDGKYRGPITMREAIRDSVNITAISVYNQVGQEICFNFAKDSFALGLEGTHSAYLSNALGSFTATPLEIAQAYSVFANQGLFIQSQCVSQIRDRQGNLVMEPRRESRRVLKESTAEAISDMLRGVVTDGTGRDADIPGRFICGQTGFTDSNEYSGGPDTWFAGYTPDHTGVVWLGYDNPNKDNHMTTESDRVPPTLWKKVITQNGHS